MNLQPQAIYLLNDSFFPAHAPQWYKMLLNFFLFAGILMIGGCFSTIIVSLALKDLKDLEDKEEESELSLYDKTCYYEMKYLKEFRELEDCELTKDEIKTLSLKNVSDETPMGKIIMTYNPETECFWYYCDTKTLTYKTLDAVARLFTIKYNCKLLCVDYQQEWEKGKLIVVKQKEEAEKKEEKEEEKEADSVFAQFKSYNTIGSRSKNSSNKKLYIHTDNSNRFSYKGKCSDYIDPSIQAEKTEKQKNLSFSEFKNLTKTSEYCDT